MASPDNSVSRRALAPVISGSIVLNRTLDVKLRIAMVLGLDFVQTS